MKFKKGHIPWTKGKKHSKETIEKMKERRSFWWQTKGKELKPIIIQKLANSHIGKKLSEEQKKKIGESNKGKHYYWLGKKNPKHSETMKLLYSSGKLKPNSGTFKKGHPSPKYWFSKKQSKEAQLKRSESLKRAYNEGRRYTNPEKEYPAAFKTWIRKEIRKRDNFTCQICGKISKSLDVHHIDYDKKNIEKQNLISLCHSCHSKTQARRNYWKSHLQQLMIQRQLS